MRSTTRADESAKLIQYNETCISWGILLKANEHEVRTDGLSDPRRNQETTKGTKSTKTIQAPGKSDKQRDRWSI
jgi:hypothetical protein